MKKETSIGQTLAGNGFLIAASVVALIVATAAVAQAAPVQTRAGSAKPTVKMQDTLRTSQAMPAAPAARKRKAAAPAAPAAQPAPAALTQQQVSTMSNAQLDALLTTRRPRNVISLEVMGRAMFYSLNYDRALNPYMNVGFGVSYLGLKTTQVTDPFGAATEAERSMVIVPVYANLYLSKASSRLFLTGGADLVYFSGEVSEASGLAKTNVAPIFGAGFEYRHENGFVFRLTPYVALAPEAFAWVGASLGGSF